MSSEDFVCDFNRKVLNQENNFIPSSGNVDYKNKFTGIEYSKELHTFLVS